MSLPNRRRLGAAPRAAGAASSPLPPLAAPPPRHRQPPSQRRGGGRPPRARLAAPPEAASWPAVSVLPPRSTAATRPGRPGPQKPAQMLLRRRQRASAGALDGAHGRLEHAGVSSDWGRAKPRPHRAPPSRRGERPHCLTVLPISVGGAASLSRGRRAVCRPGPPLSVTGKHLSCAYQV